MSEPKEQDTEDDFLDENEFIEHPHKPTVDYLQKRLEAFEARCLSVLSRLDRLLAP